MCTLPVCIAPRITGMRPWTRSRVRWLSPPRRRKHLLTLTMVYAGVGDAAMAREIGRRLMDLWRDADPDFRSRIELQRILKTAVPHTV